VIIEQLTPHTATRKIFLARFGHAEPGDEQYLRGKGLVERATGIEPV